MDLNLIIYAVMAGLALLCLINPVRCGIIPMVLASRAMKRAAQNLEEGADTRDLRDAILDPGKDQSATTLFSIPALQDQVRRYINEVRRVSSTQQGRCLCDLGDFFDDALLDHISSATFVEHTITAMTGLGILGTFIGMAVGLTGFDADTTDAALDSISVLLGGMKYAFTTSIVGILLSLGLGTLYRPLRRSAEKNMDQFVEVFHRKVLNNQQAAGFNQVVERMRSIENHLAHRPDDNMEMLRIVLEQFMDELAVHLADQINDMREAMIGTTEQQEKYTTAIENLNRQIETAGIHVASVSDNFGAIATQSAMLADQIASAGSSLRTGMQELRGMIETDSAILEKQLSISAQLNDSAVELTSLAEVVSQQARNTAGVVNQLAKFTATAVDETAAGCNKLVEEHYGELKERMQMLMGVAAEQTAQVRAAGDEALEQIREANSQSMEQIRLGSEKTLENIRIGADNTMNTIRADTHKALMEMPQTVAVRKELDELALQNQQLIENQLLIIQNISQRNRMVARLARLWRNEK